ncbi:IS5 transposase [Enterobacter asburiae]|uniref:IS5 transposase n=1 Tax=Enterobacter asburiae TaxID=61645 RepID=A0A376FGE8_ENTAS|nr:IS5 transposase [Enterobacter asburiae]
MSHQLTFADSEFSSKRRQTRKEIFLSRMEQILPWQNMVEVIEPFYPKAGNGRRPYPLETMLRIHCMQHWYNLSDGADGRCSVRNRLPCVCLPGYPWIAPCRTAPPS